MPFISYFMFLIGIGLFRCCFDTIFKRLFNNRQSEQPEEFCVYYNPYLKDGIEAENNSIPSYGSNPWLSSNPSLRSLSPFSSSSGNSEQNDNKVPESH